MKKIVKLVVMSVLAMVVSVSAFAKNAVVYVGTNAEFAPFEYLDKNQIVGFDIDLLNAISKEAGIEFKIQDMAFDGLLPALQTKKVDLVIAGMTATPERQKAVAFSKPYFKAKQVVITKGVDKSLKDFKDLVFSGVVITTCLALKYGLEKATAFCLSGVADIPAITISIFLVCKAGSKPSKAISCILNSKPVSFEIASSKSISKPTILFFSRYSKGANSAFVPT